MRIAVAQIGARMHYAVPRIFSEAGLLETLFTDLCATHGLWRFLDHVPSKILPAPIRRIVARKPRGVEIDKVVSFNSLGLSYGWRLKRCRDPFQKASVNIWVGEEFARRILTHGLGKADTIYAFNSAGRALLKFARQHGIRTILEQTIAPVSIQLDLLQDEQKRWPGWEVDNLSSLQPYADLEAAEWALSDLIVCGSAFVREGIEKINGPVERSFVVPYGVEIPESDNEENRTTSRIADRPLRVLTVGTVCLRKGSPYIGEVATKLKGVAEFRIVGPVELTEFGRNHLSRSVQLIGAIPRAEIARHYKWADVFLLPSICEGSATVLYEALAFGLPIITTANSGGPIKNGIDGLIVPAKDVDAICAAIERIISKPDLMDTMSRASYAKREEICHSAYATRLLRAVQSLEKQP